MNHKIQITVDDKLDDVVRNRAKQMGLSVSSYARLALIKGLASSSLLDQSIDDINSHHTEGLTLAQFHRQLDDL